MRKKYIFGKKLYISILTSLVVLITTVATTFAWVGVFANSTFDTFSINIVRSELFEDYNIVISSTGKPGTFSDTIDSYDIKRQILVNWGYPEEWFLTVDFENKTINDEDRIDDYFRKLNLDQATTLPVVNGNSLKELGQFYDVFGNLTTKYFKFDVYLSTEQIGVNSSSDFNLDVFLGLNSLSGRIKGKELMNPVYYPDDFINPYDSLIQNDLMNLPTGHRTVKANEKITYAQVDSKYASRLAFEKYEVVEKGNQEAYLNKSPVSTVIYTGDEYEYPVLINENQKLYNFGSILPNELNLAILNYNSSEWQFANWRYWVMDMPTDIYNVRGVESVTKDLIINKENNHLINSSKLEEQIDINHMMKLTCYFWFEGWDADCWNAINASPVSINISFNMRNDD